MVERWRTNQPGGESNDTDRRLGRLCHIKQVVQQRLIVVLSEQVKLIKNKNDGFAPIVTYRPTTALLTATLGSHIQSTGHVFHGF